MKSCPTCDRTFADDTLTFCLVDGSILSAAYDPETNQPYQRRRVEPPPTEIFHSTRKESDNIPSPLLQPTLQASPLIYTPDSNQSQPIKKGIGRRWLIVGIAASLVMIFGLMVVRSRGKWFVSHNSIAKKTETKPTTLEQLNVVGTWWGNYGMIPAHIVIDNQEGDSFSGTLSGTLSTGGLLTSISGRVNQNTRQVTIQETRVLKEPKSGGFWALGTNNGLISSDGLTMSGEGKDERNPSYSWSFSKK